MIETFVILLLLVPLGVTVFDSTQENEVENVSYVNEIRIPIDRDGNEYSYKKIGNLYWFTEDLRTTSYDDGTPIPIMYDSLWSNSKIGAIAGNKETPVNYYNYYAAIDNRDICPYGWRIPTHSDWENLANALGGKDVAGGLLKGFEFWNFPNEGATNFAGWEALPFGFVDDRGIPSGIGMSCGWWSINESDSNLFEIYITHYTIDDLVTQKVSPNMGVCVRCVTESLDDYEQ